MRNKADSDREAVKLAGREEASLKEEEAVEVVEMEEEEVDDKEEAVVKAEDLEEDKMEEALAEEMEVVSAVDKEDKVVDSAREALDSGPVASVLAVLAQEAFLLHLLLVAFLDREASDASSLTSPMPLFFAIFFLKNFSH